MMRTPNTKPTNQRRNISFNIANLWCFCKCELFAASYTCLTYDAITWNVVDFIGIMRFHLYNTFVLNFYLIIFIFWRIMNVYCTDIAMGYGGKRISWQPSPKCWHLLNEGTGDTEGSKFLKLYFEWWQQGRTLGV